jgi:hypothetical protein
LLQSYTSFCHSVGNILAVTSTDEATIAPAAATSPGVLGSGTSVATSLPSVAPTQTGTSGASKKFGISVSLLFLGKIHTLIIFCKMLAFSIGLCFVVVLAV